MRATKFKTEVLQLRLHMIKPQSVGERGIEIVGLSGYLHLFVGAHRRQRAHIVQTVGEFHHDWADIALHRVEYLAEIVHLLAHVVVLLLFLGQHIYKKGHIVAKPSLYLPYWMRSVFHHIVKKSGYHRVDIKMQNLGGNSGHSV